MRHLYGYGLLLVIALLTWTTPSHAVERILDYRADIELAADGSMVVTEHIRAFAEGKRIRHGIYRDFPTDYRDPLHNRYRVGFKVIAVERDGKPEAWHSEPRSNGVRVYLGNSDSQVSIGEHTYSLHYQSNRQIGFFDDHDELFWNVTGNGWDFLIERASATVRLPEAIKASDLKAFGYTGIPGSREQALNASTETGGASYRTTRTLLPAQGLSITLEFPKGVIAAPSRMQQLFWLLQDNRNLLLGLLGLALLWLYYGVTWRRHGRDPAAGPRMAEYEPPGGDSAAALRYVRRMGFDDTCFTAGVLGIAAKGGLEVTLDAAEHYSVTRNDEPSSPLTTDEQALSDTLFAGGTSLTFLPSSHLRVGEARKALETALSDGYKKKFFVTNTLKLIPGVLISLLTLLVIARGSGPEAAFMLLWLTMFSFATYFLAVKASEATQRRGKGIGAAWFAAAAFGAGSAGGAYALGTMAGFAVLPVFFALIGTNIAFYHWMKAPTQAGAKLLDRIEGFRWYLGVAEKQELDSRYKPESHPELFAAYLPYALALDVDNAWTARFAAALTPMQMEQAQPGWYRSHRQTGGFNSSNFSSFSSGLAAGVGGAIAASSVSPGSSSGSSRSSGSGGGGGGGGGGGW